MVDSPHFLYVEDDLRSRKVMLTLLERVMKFSNVTIFEDSSNFTDQLHSLPTPPDVIFLDIQMGPIDGYQMLEIIRGIPEYQNTTVIAMTANVMSHDVEKLKQSSFNGLIGKPILSHVFPQLIDKILKNEPVWFVP